MRILLAFYPIDDMGGMINHNEQLCAGLEELGHEVHTRVFLPREDVPRNGVAGGRGTTGHADLEFDQRRGYSWPRAACVPYYGRANRSAVELLESFDLVIWQVAVPTKRKENLGNMDWLKLYDARVKQVAVIHDGNFLASYPWLYYVRKKLSGLACVHHCAMNSARHISTPSALILNPQEIGELPDLSHSAWRDRRPGFLSVQTWKAWKRVPELLAALPYATDIVKSVAGKGIDYYYLTSEDKCKYPGVWDAAMRSGMQYLDVITNQERDNILQSVTCLVDPSWSKKYAAIGGHFNRVMIDAIKMGALPIVRPWGIGADANGAGGELFVSGENCVSIPQNVGPAEYGALLTEYCHMEYGKYVHIMGQAVELLPRFERKLIAQQFINLAYGDLAVSYGFDSPQVKLDASEAIINFFGAAQ